MSKRECSTCKHFSPGALVGIARDGVTIRSNLHSDGLCRRPAKGFFGGVRPANKKVLEWWTCEKHTETDP